jgi:cysteine desulfurase/selenocysteine lyase
LSQLATEEMELSRQKIQRFINAKHDYEVIFTKGTTEGINLVAYALTNQIKKDDEIIISYLEHHSNIVPWQMLCERTGAKLKVIPMDENGILQIDVLDSWLNEKQKLFLLIRFLTLWESLIQSNRSLKKQENFLMLIF